MLKELEVDTVPEIVRLLNDMLELAPVIVLPVPLIVTVPLPPEVCVNVPEPEVEKFPATVKLVALEDRLLAPVTVKS